MFKKDDRTKLLSVLLESGQLELLLSTGLVGGANKKLREALCHNIAKLLCDPERKVETEPEQVSQAMVLSLTTTLNEAVEVQEGSSLLLLFCSTLLEKLEIGIARSVVNKLPHLLDRLCELIFTLPAERSAREASELMWGVMLLTKIILARKDLNQSLDEHRLLNYLL